MKKIETVYIAGPYTRGDQSQNVRKAIEVADSLCKLGYKPFVPHLSHFWHFLIPHEYEFWMEQDLYWLRKCDAVFRLPGESVGADREESEAKKLGIPVYHSDKELIADNMISTVQVMYDGRAKSFITEDGE